MPAPLRGSVLSGDLTSAQHDSLSKPLELRSRGLVSSSANGTPVQPHQAEPQHGRPALRTQVSPRGWASAALLLPTAHPPLPVPDADATWGGGSLFIGVSMMLGRGLGVGRP